MEAEAGAWEPHTQRLVTPDCYIPSSQDSSLVLLHLMIIIFVAFTIIS